MKNKGKILIVSGICLILAALSLLFYNFCDEYKAGKATESLLSQVDISEDENSGIPDYILNPKMPMPTKSADGVDYIGILEIEAINMKMPIISTATDKNLKKAPCRYSGSAYLNDMVISGHDYRIHFGYISNLKPGDKITFTDVDGNKFNYEVLYKEILHESDSEDMIIPEGWDLTLFTCTYDGRHRVTVRAKSVQ